MPQPPTPPPIAGDASSARGTAPPGKFFRRFRRTVRALFIVGMILPVVAVVVTQGPVPKWLVERSIRKATGAEFDADWVSLKLDGRFIATKATLTAPPQAGLVGEAAHIASADRIEVVLDWSAWAAGVVEPVSVKVIKPLVRLSLDRQTQRLNLARLHPEPGARSSIARVPRIEIDHGVLVVGEHGEPGPGAEGAAGGGYGELVRFDIGGWVSPILGKRRYLVHFTAANPDDALMAFSGTGEVDLADLHGEIATSAVDLSRWEPQHMPTLVRPLWEELRLRGRIAGTVVRYSSETALDTTITLQDVALSAPIASGRAEITGSRKPRMEQVTGTLRLVGAGPAAGLHADLSGLFEDLPARVRLDSRGLDIDAEYSAVVLAEKFQLEKNPRILWFAPEVVHENFERFSGPTALIDARIEVNRRPPIGPGVPGDTSIAGTLVFQNGQLAYNLFPYPVVDMAGTVRFENDTVQIVGIQGRGPTGARMFAEGTIDPPVEGAGYEVRVTATDLPMDDVLRAALAQSQGEQMVKAVFSQRRYAELIEKGLVRPGVDGAPPDFRAFSGMIDSLQIHVFCGFEPGKPVHQDIAVRFREVHALPEAFPYPLSGRDVSVRIGDDFVLARGEGLTGLHGGTASFDASVGIVRGDRGVDYRPTVRLRTRMFPIDPLLINAIPQGLGAADAAPDTGSFSIKRYLTGLRLRGPVDADIGVEPGAHPGDAPEVTASVLFDGVEATPDHAGLGAPVVLRDLSGAFKYEPAGGGMILVDGLEGRLLRASPPPDDQGPPLPTSFTINGEWLLAPELAPAGRASAISVATRELDAEIAFEDLLRPIVPGTADSIGELRRERSPSGRADVGVSVRQAAEPGDGGPLTTVNAVIAEAENLQADVDGDRVELFSHGGSLAVEVAIPARGPAAAPRLTLDGLDADLLLGGRSLGRLAASGEVSLPTEGSPEHPATPLLVHRDTELVVRGMRLESPVVRQVATRFGGAGIAGALARYNPEGIVDGEARLSLTPGESDHSKWTPWFAARPRWLAFTVPDGDAPGDVGRRLLLPLMSGQVTADGASGRGGEGIRSGRIEELTVVDEGWSARFNGRWTIDPGPEPGTPTPWSIAGAADFDSQGIPPTLIALLPPSVGQAVEGAKLQVLGGVEATVASLRLWSDGDDAEPICYDLRGTAVFNGLFADPGVVIDDARGTLGFSAERPPHRPGHAGITLENAMLRIGGLRVSNAAGTIATAEVESPTAPRKEGGDGPTRTFEVPALTGDAYGGRIVIAARAGSYDGGEVRYDGAVQIAGVRFADILRDLQRNRPALEGPRPPVSLSIDDDDLPRDGSRGLVQAELTLRGVTGDPASRTGRGQLSIAGGQAVLDLPGLTTLLSIVSLQLPDASPFDYVHADAHISGDTVHFDRLAVLSDSLAILGGGTMNIDTFGLDVRLVGRGRARLPFFTDLLDAFRDELMTARIRGTPEKPDLTFENFSAVRSVFGAGSGPLGDAISVNLDQLERDRQRTLGTAGLLWGPVAEQVSPIPAPSSSSSLPPSPPPR